MNPDQARQRSVKFCSAPWNCVRGRTLQVGCCSWTNTLKQVRRLLFKCLIATNHGAHEGSALGCFPRSLHNFTKLAQCRSVTFAPTTFKRSQTVGSDCKVIQQELRVCFTSQVKTGEVPISKILSKCSVSGCCQPLPALVSTPWDFCEVPIHQVRKSQFLQRKPQGLSATHRQFSQSQV